VRGECSLRRCTPAVMEIERVGLGGMGAGLVGEC